MRPVDADELAMFPYLEWSGTEQQIAEWIEQAGLSEDDTADRARELCWKVIAGCINVVKTQPTITLHNKAEKAIQRMGRFGKLFLDYSGDPRGKMGTPGDSTDEEWVTMMDPIQDVEGEWWRPVQEQALQNLICKVKSLEFTPPNEPLTIEQLREMDGEPVWVTPLGFWALVIAKPGKRVQLISNDGETVWADKEIELVGPIYRRPPERQEDT